MPTLVNNVPKHMPDKRPVTLRMVAARAGVSLATASYALRSGSRAVTPALRQRVIDAADELGYELRPRGRLRTRALTVAAVVPDPTNSFFSDVLRAAEATLRAGGHRLVVSSSGEDETQEEEIVSTVLRGRIDGLLLAPAGPVGPAVRALAAS
ncbi:MAG TPA: LacI family DNA-binding transcriptional regulator, partial [Acidimicrobiales bacterium]|nr:LacI family DNA-binding transcriptional regulator [Acidimicrobiales bacterium]